MFERYRHDPALHRSLLTTDPRRHPWLRWGLTPRQIAQAQADERAWLSRPRGAGDVVAAATRAVGIKPCEPCQRRQQTLNRWFPFR